MTRIVARLAAAGAVILLLSGPAAIAHAGWSASGVGEGRAGARFLAVPSNVTATCAPLSTTIDVAWTALDSPPHVSGYQVARSADGGASWSYVGGSVPATTATTYTLADPGLPVGTYRYRVTAIQQNWTATSAATATRVVAITVCT